MYMGVSTYIMYSSIVCRCGTHMWVTLPVYYVSCHNLNAGIQFVHAQIEVDWALREKMDAS